MKKALWNSPFLSFPDFERLFVVDTHASSTADGALPMQKKEDGELHPIEFASRAMISSDGKYSACEMEALVLIFSLRNFRTYLLSTQPFVLRTEHKSLSYSFQKKDIHRRLARCYTSSHSKISQWNTSLEGSIRWRISFQGGHRLHCRMYSTKGIW